MLTSVPMSYVPPVGDAVPWPVTDRFVSVSYTPLVGVIVPLPDAVRRERELLDEHRP